jgi:hypothetical protein
MDKLIQYIKTLLTEEELEMDCGSYFITSHTALQRRKTSENLLLKDEIETMKTKIKSNLNI